MKHLKRYNLFESKTERPVISYDFDGVLHKSVIHTHPLQRDFPKEWEPFQEIFDQMKKEHDDGNKIVVVSARDDYEQRVMWEYIKMHDLPVEEVYTTNDESKIPILKKIGAVKHYDDKDISKEVKKAGIEFVLVDPISGLFESENSIKTYEFTLKNPQFFISDPTVKSFVQRLKKEFGDLVFYNEKEDGRIKDGRIIYVRSLGLDREKLDRIIKDFVNKYDNMRIVYVVK